MSPTATAAPDVRPPAAAPPLTPRRKAAGYAGISRIQVRITMAYRSDYLFALVGLLLQVYLLRVVWTAVFPEDGTAAGADGRPVTLAVQIAYVSMAGVQYWLFQPWQLSMVPQRVREGTVAIDLARPLSFPGQMVAAQLGSGLAMLPFALVALPFAVLVGGAVGPYSAGAAAAYAFSLVPAYLITVLLNLCVSMVAFWTLEVGGFFMVYKMVAQFLAGALVPLYFMPDWLAAPARWLPFQSTVYAPLAVYLGQIRGAGEIAATIGVQLLWLAVLVALLRLLWSRALHRVVVQGG